MACNNLADRSPLQAAPVWTDSHTDSEKKEPLCILLPRLIISPKLDVLAAGTSGRHMHFAREGWSRRGLS